ncbi:MAG TPA: diguanylate cyclase [Lysobacter sp.]|nr:diguanylate cyclase [Lysobacter sp.]
MEWKRLRVCSALLLWLAFTGQWAQAMPASFEPVSPAPAGATSTPLELDAQISRLELTPHIGYYHDAAGRDDLPEAMAMLRAGRFAPLPDGNTAFGFQPGAYWFHARVINRNPREPRWLLVQKYALSDHIDVHAVHADGRVESHVGGDALPFDARSIRYRLPNFWVRLPVGEPVDLMVRVSSQSSMQVPLWLYTPAAFAEVSRDAQFGIGLYYGILLALFFYNLVLWLRLRDPSYFWYLLHLSAFGLVLFTLNGLGFEYLWSNSPWLADKSVPVLICLAQVGMQQFARSFLELHQRWRFGDRVGLAMIGFFIVLGIAALWLPYRISTPIASASVFVSIGWIAVEAVVVMLRGYKPAQIFLLAWAMLLLGTGMFAAIAFGLLPKNFITEYGVQIGSASEMLLLSIALGYRYAALRSENEQIVRVAKLELEQTVERRTAELRNALSQLGDAHARLRESSQRDSLTGLHTRAHFIERFAQLMVQSHSQNQPLSLLMIDLDHFKQINDCHGHLVGDDCLRWAAHTIGQTLRAHGALLARFGGEEFVVGLPGLDRQAAILVAEDLRQHLHDTPCVSGDTQIPLSASIGVHQLQLDGNKNVSTALRHADEALYQAKADGRDCVRWYSDQPLAAR